MIREVKTIDVGSCRWSQFILFIPGVGRTRHSAWQGVSGVGPSAIKNKYAPVETICSKIDEKTYFPTFPFCVSGFTRPIDGAALVAFSTRF